MSERRLFVHELEARLDELLLLALRQRSGRLAALALEALPRDMQDRVLHWVAVAAQSSTELGGVLASHAAAHLLKLDEWALAGLAAFDQGGLVAAAAVLASHPDDLHAAGAAQGSVQGSAQGKSVPFADVESRLVHVLQALAGQSLKLAPGLTAWTDTETLWLPETLVVESGHESVHLSAEAYYRRYKCMMALLWAQLHFGSFDLDPEPALALWADRDGALAWLALFEAIRLEACLKAELPGLAADISGLRGPWPAVLAPAVTELSRPAASVADSLRWMSAFMAERAMPPRFPHVFALDPAAVRQRVRQRGAARIAAEIPGRMAGRPLNIVRGAGGNPDTVSSPVPRTGEGDAQPDSAADLACVPPPADRSGSSAQQLDLSVSGALHPAGPGVWSPTSGGEAELATSSQTPDARYDEWDYRRQAWRVDWCQLFEADATSGDLAWVDEVRLRHAHLIRSVRRRFEALRGEDRVHRRQFEGEEIDLDAHVESWAERKGGGEGSSRLFTQRRRSERSLAVMFMIDMSGSTKGWVNDAERESLVLLCEAIEALGDSYAIYGFSGWTRARCDIYRVKRFDDRYDNAVRQRIAGIEAKDYTRMGVAVRHLSGLLQRQPARHKLLVTLSDGRPDDHGDEYRGRYGIEDTRHALLEARGKGIQSFCITIDRHGADYLPQLYGRSHYAVIDDARKLPQKIARIYRRLTA